MRLGDAQLAAWQEIAETWPVALDEDGIGRCSACGKGVILWLDPNGHPFLYTHEQVMAQTVLHLRNHHPDLDPDRPPQPL